MAHIAVGVGIGIGLVFGFGIMAGILGVIVVAVRRGERRYPSAGRAPNHGARAPSADRGRGQHGDQPGEPPWWPAAAAVSGK